MDTFGKHQYSTHNHPIERFVFANATDRAAGTPNGVTLGGSAYTIVVEDIGQVAYQSDTHTYWRLTGVGPYAWLQVGAAGAGGGLVAANNLSDVADAGVSRTNLGVEIGTDVQAYDAELAALASLTSAADEVPYFTGLGTAALAAFTSVARTLLAATTAAFQRTALGLGTVSTLDSDTDGTLTANSDTKVATQKAAKTYVDAQFSGGGGAPSSAHYVTTQAESGLSAEANLGGLTTGIVKIAVSAGVATPSTATEGTDYWKPGGTDVAVADGGTGASTAGAARTNLGVVIGTDVQAHDADLDTIASLTATTDSILQSKSSTWAARTLAQVAADLQGTSSTTLAAGNDSRFTTITGNNQTGTSYTLVLADAGKVVECNNASAIALTIPPVSSVVWPVGTVIEVWQQGAGQVTITAGAGVTLRSDGSKIKTTAQYATISLRMRANDEWVLSGDLSL